MKEFLSKYPRKQLIRAGFALVIYLLWVIWLGNYWFLLGLPIVFDMYLTRRVNWSPWKKREGKNPLLVEWFDALIFAIIAVTIINIFLFQNYKIPTGSMEKSLLIGDHLYVSKVAYGPRIPFTPLALPFMQHTIPGSKSKSYVEWVQWDYKRLIGFSKVKRNNPVVFNFPEGDTVAFERSAESYYSILMEETMRLKAYDQMASGVTKDESYYTDLARKNIWNNYTMVVRPIDKRDNYIKRCVAIAGDSLQIINGVVFIDGKQQEHFPGVQYTYRVETNGKPLNTNRLNKNYGIYQTDMMWSPDHSYLNATLTGEMVEEIGKINNVDNIERNVIPAGIYDWRIFPHDERYRWNLDNFGPLYIPQKGATIDISLDNLSIYERIIGYYEGNDLVIKDSTIYINGEATNQYTFKMDYYWMMGDNRHHSLDSRYWGFVPEDHVIGRPRFVWLSLDPEKNFPMNVRLKRMFTWIK